MRFALRNTIGSWEKYFSGYSLCWNRAIFSGCVKFIRCDFLTGEWMSQLFCSMWTLPEDSQTQHSWGIHGICSDKATTSHLFLVRFWALVRPYFLFTMYSVWFANQIAEKNCFQRAIRLLIQFSNSAQWLSDSVIHWSGLSDSWVNRWLESRLSLKSVKSHKAIIWLHKTWFC